MRSAVQYKDDVPDGFGVWNRPNGEVYRGAWKCGVRHGVGTFKYQSGGVYKCVPRRCRRVVARLYQ
jgi:hypothetical protein